MLQWLENLHNDRGGRRGGEEERITLGYQEIYLGVWQVRNMKGMR